MPAATKHARRASATTPPRLSPTSDAATAKRADPVLAALEARPVFATEVERGPMADVRTLWEEREALIAAHGNPYRRGCSVPDDAMTRLDAVGARIIEAPATSIADLRLKAEVLLDDTADFESAAPDPTDLVRLRALCRDLLALHKTGEDEP